MILSEEFAFPLEDGTGPIVDEMEKEKEERDKDLTDYMGKKEKTAEDINKDPNLKEVELTKPFKDKLKLAEPDDEDKLNECFEQDLDEALPKDLAHAYKHFDEINTRDRGVVYKNSNGYGNIKNRNTFIDFDKSEYEEITPDEAIALKKQGRLGDVRFVFDGQLVIYNNENKPLTKARRWSGNNRDLYIDSKGRMMDYSTQLPFKEFVEKADKIYVSHEVAIDLEQRAERRSNPESRAYSGKFVARDVLGDRYNNYNWSDLPEKGVNTTSKLQLKREQNRLAALDPQDPNYELRVDQIKKDINYWQAILSREEQKSRDYKVELRNTASNLKLREPVNKYNELKDKISSTQHYINRAQQAVDDAKANGSPESQRLNRDLQNKRDELKYLKRRIMELEDQLDMLDDNAKIKDLEATLDKYTQEASDLQAEMNKLLRKP